MGGNGITHREAVTRLMWEEPKSVKQIQKEAGITDILESLNLGEKVKAIIEKDFPNFDLLSNKEKQMLFRYLVELEAFKVKEENKG